MENASKALIIAGAILISILLISIGIILINSGKDITSTGTSQMNSQKIQTFNSQFTAYEGKRKGSEIKSLINVVNASNGSDSEHQVMVYTSVKSGSNYITSISQLNSTTDYTVELNYSDGSSTTVPTGVSKLAGGTTLSASEKGYINYIVIK